ncbi:hypothetical protein [Sphingobacterium sp. BS-2]|uniref:hypothetical protein n=1 Tax=Sphingobacterium sp. BS-2 TaxID=3377129 RepID=UPI0038FBEAF0
MYLDKLNIAPTGYKNNKLESKGSCVRFNGKAEVMIEAKSKFTGLRVGLTKDYSNALNEYIKRGHLTDKLGIGQKTVWFIYY